MTLTTVAHALCVGGCWEDLSHLAATAGDIPVALAAALTHDTLQAQETFELSQGLLQTLIMKLVIKSVKSGEDSVDEVFSPLHKLLQLAAMTKIHVVIDVMEYLLNEIENKIGLLRFDVEGDIYLPAPPIFCPQLQLETDDDHEQSR